MLHVRKSGEPEKWRSPDHTSHCFVCDIRHNHVVTSRLVMHSLTRRVSLKRLRVPLARRPPPRGSGPLYYLVRAFISNVAILASEEQQRFAFAHHYFLYLCDKDCVIAGVLR
jgi:hypothetical protein